MDSDRLFCWLGDWSTDRVHDADDGGTAADSVFARLRRACFGLDWNRRVLSPNAARLCHDGADCRNFAWIPYVYGELNGLREVAGDAAHPAPYVPRAEFCEPRDLRTGRGPRRRADS